MASGPTERDRLGDGARFVLVGPQSAGNVGASARALKNLGFSRLAVVAPACDPVGEEARRMAVDASDVLEAADVVFDLDRALDGASVVVGTSRRTGRQRKPHWSLPELAPALVRLVASGEVAIVFGREDSGLTDAELDRCTHLVRIPSSSAYPSLNLAQAVLLVAWELRRAATDGGEAPGAAVRPLAEHGEREAMHRHLALALDAVGFLEGDGAEGILRRLRRILGRAELDEGDVRLFRGIARQVLWAAGRAGLVVPDETALRRADAESRSASDEET